MKNDTKNQIEAEVILRAAPSSATKSKQSHQVESIEPSEALLEEAGDVSEKLLSMGFEVLAASPLTISISGPKDMFERIFQVDIAEHDEANSLNVPQDIDHDVEGIYIQVPPTYYK